MICQAGGVQEARRRGAISSQSPGRTASPPRAYAKLRLKLSNQASFIIIQHHRHSSTSQSSLSFSLTLVYACRFSGNYFCRILFRRFQQTI